MLNSSFYSTGVLVPPIRHYPNSSLLQLTRYVEGGTCLVLTTKDQLAIVCKASVYIHSGIPDRFAYIKTWGENEGVLEALEKSGAVSISNSRVNVAHNNWAQLVQLQGSGPLDALSHMVSMEAKNGD